MTLIDETMVTLTERQHEVLYHLSYGLSYPDMAPLMHLTEYTVKSHAQRLFRALGVVSQPQAVRVGFELGFLTPYRQRSAAAGPSGDEEHIAACYAAEACPCRPVGGA